MLRKLTVVIVLLCGVWRLQAATCTMCKGRGQREIWKTCEKCGGSGSMHFNRTSNHNRRIVNGREVVGYGARGARVFNDGKTGQGVTRCTECQYGLGNKHNGKVRVMQKCQKCNGTGNISDSVNKVSPAGGKSAKPVAKKPSVSVDADLEMAKLKMNTEFVSYKCRYLKECEHCNRLAQKSGLTQSYCEQCYICKKKRLEAADKNKKLKDELKEYELLRKKINDDADMVY